MFFKAKKENLYNPEIGFYKAYGIEAVDECTKKPVIFVSDVFLCKEKARAFARLLNECGAELVHLEELCRDAVER